MRRAVVKDPSAPIQAPGFGLLNYLQAWDVPAMCPKFQKRDTALATASLSAFFQPTILIPEGRTWTLTISLWQELYWLLLSVHLAHSATTYFSPAPPTWQASMPLPNQGWLPPEPQLSWPYHLDNPAILQDLPNGQVLCMFQFAPISIFPGEIEY